jgi:hypothetical protein
MCPSCRPQSNALAREIGSLTAPASVATARSRRGGNALAHQLNQPTNSNQPPTNQLNHSVTAAVLRSHGGAGTAGGGSGPGEALRHPAAEAGWAWRVC